MQTTARCLVLASALAVVGCSREDHSPSSTRIEARSSAGGEATTARGPGQHVARRAMLEVHATYRVSVDSARETTEAVRRVTAFTEAHDGWVQSSSVSDSGEAGTLTLRVAPDALGELRATLGQLAGGGRAVSEQIRRTDVTDALMDLDARLRVARATETRLLTLLDQRTGTLADVLAVERSLGEQRTLIEQMESEQRAAQGRVDLATVEVWLDRSALASHAPLSRQASLALRDGLATARSLTVGVLTLGLRAGPSLALVALGLLAMVAAVRAATRARQSG